MQVLFKDNFVQLVAESKAESYKLLDFIYKKGEETSSPSPVNRQTKKYKKHNPVIPCKFCGKGYKMRKGMGLHLRKCAKRILSTSSPEMFISSSATAI